MVVIWIITHVCECTNTPILVYQSKNCTYSLAVIPDFIAAHMILEDLRPAESLFLCLGCECNNHAQSCRFDQAVYEASGRRSGGVCESCQHHTTGPQCGQCAPGYQPNPRSRMDQPDACTRERTILPYNYTTILPYNYTTILLYRAGAGLGDSTCITLRGSIRTNY